MNGWLNLYKTRGISSAKAVGIIKNCFKDSKIGHTGTLDLEAEGILPIAIGEATKLVSILVNSQKQYVFTIQFGAQTTTGDSAGEIIKKTKTIPLEYDCKQICNQFIGEVEQTPPAYSAIKINGIRAYKLARENKKIELKQRLVKIYNLKLLKYDVQNKNATYLVDCSKGTYIRSLSEDISLSLHSLGFVIELQRTRVGIFTRENATNILDLSYKDFDMVRNLIKSKCLKTEEVLEDIPVLEVDRLIARKIKYGQKCSFDGVSTYEQVWLRYNSRILAIGSLSNNYFISSRVFNYIEMEENNVDTGRNKK